MEELRQWLPVVIIILTNAVVLTVAFMSLKGDVRVLSEKNDGVHSNLSDKIEVIGKSVEEIKTNHLVHLTADIKEVSDKLTSHLMER